MLVALCLLIVLSCYFGNEIMVQCDELCTDLYKSNWLTMDVKQRKIIITFMERLKRPTVIRVAHLFVLGLNTFTSVE